MAKKCSFDNDCLGEPSAECSCRNPTILLCEKHLQIHIMSSSTQNHKIKSLIVPIPNDKKQIISTEILKIKINLSIFSQEYTNKVRELVERIYNKYSKCMGKIKKLDNSLTEMHELVNNIKEIKLYEKHPEIVSVLLNEKENLIKKFQDLNLVNLEFVYKGNVIAAKLRENTVRNMNIESESLVQGLCNKGHKLYLSIDNNKYYSYLNGQNTNTICDVCRSFISSNGLHCRICSFDLCDSCIIKKNYFKYPKLTCSKHHELFWVDNFKGSHVTCDLCGYSYSNCGWKCYTCDYDSCIKCGLRKGVLAPFVNPITCSEGHKLHCLDTSNVSICSLCQANIDYPHWRCEECAYSLCRNCCSLRGFNFIYCQNNHQMVTHKKGKFSWGFKSTTCKECMKKLDDTGFTCRTCKAFLCEACFAIRPNSFFKSS
ncbi:hypothetical protein SteCoe_29964 [Stentor coeruleus]|uniref:Phorbol-ester/DAG-type domain-containing protein n=1 Tax=Stentor coeruleus TaxID=5963 RepID=A0A1R2B4Z1_9CILI|nr:hypothetical protein SteCoe_29964 [Stentor coeruleus]